MAKENNAPYTQPDPTPAAELFDVEHAMALMVEGAAGALRWLRDPARARSKEHHAELGRMVKDALLTCRALSQPPPTELIELIGLLLDVDGRRDDARHRKVKQWRAARFMALHPRASMRKVSIATGADRKLLAAWKKENYFHDLVLGFRRAKPRKPR